MNIYKSVKNKAIDCDNFSKCWEIEIIDGTEMKTLPVAEFNFQMLTKLSGKFTHKELTLEVVLIWSTLNDWATSCNIAFKTDKSVRVTSLTFKTPERVLPRDADGQDYLMYPFKTGIKIPTPAQTLFNEFKCKDTRYGPSRKTRHLNVIQSGLAPITDAEIETKEEPVNEFLKDFSQKIVSDKAEWGRTQAYSYPGGISMAWMDYCGPHGGIYFAAHDACHEKARLFFAAERGQRGIVLGIDKIFNRHLTQWDCSFVTGQHEKDWHQGAELYREYMNSVLPATVAVPEFFKKSPGFITHYDLKWEEGTVTHRYSDIPAMYEEAANYGFNTLLLGGWNNGGFDNYTLNYASDPELGTETELKNAVKKVHASGGKVLFYVNALSISMDNTSYLNTGKKYAIRKRDGEINCFGEFFLEHPMATLCNSVEAWRDNIKRNIKYVLLELNADGIYLDQVGSTPRECYNENHNHLNPWAMNYRILLIEIRQELKELGKEDYILLTEYPIDLYKDLIDSFLCYSFWQSANELCYPAMFRYTFPEVQLIDMLLQKPWLGRLSSLENKFVQEICCRQFTNGLKYWTYCHAPENKQLKPFFVAAIGLYRHAVEYFSNGEYLDDINILDKTPGILVKEFAVKDKGHLFAIWNSTGKEACFSLPAPLNVTISMRNLENPDQPCELNFIGNKLESGKSLLTIIEFIKV